ncbi:MAG: DNA polymerase IV [Actinobacteria bacterium]|nr:DNA polymerase IV [Actinomycetota bacterium]
MPESPAPRPRRVVLHADVDSMFAQVHQRDDPTLVGQAVLVGGTGPRSVVAAASVEAKREGVRSAMPMSTAVRMLPSYVIAAPDHQRYRRAGAHVMAVLEAHADDGLVEQVSIDEAYLAVTSVDPERAAQRVVDAVVAEVGLTISVGAASTKLGAKLLSGHTKRVLGPGSVTWMDDPELLAWMATLPARALPGCGPVTAAALHDAGIETVADLRTVDRVLLRRVVGKAAGAALVAAAHNHASSTIDPPSERKQVSHERTFTSDLATAASIGDAAASAAEAVAGQLDRAGRYARTATVKLRTAGFDDRSRSRTIAAGTRDAEVLGALARELAAEAWEAAGEEPIRLVGFSASNLSDVEQPTLFA